MGKTLLVFGHGYSAMAISRLLIADGWRVIGTTRDQARLGDMASIGVEGRIWPGDDLSADIMAASHVLVSIAPQENGDPVLNTVGGDFGSGLKWFGYLSTTAVYGDHQGGWVDEGTPPSPATKRGEWRVAAEQGWTALAQTNGLPLHIFRLAGIYGPGRGPFAKVRAGTARRIIKQGQVFSRIHLEDIAQILAASIKRPDPGAIYNLCDDEAAPPEDVIGLAAELLGLPVPEAVDFEVADLTPMARSFYGESKRIRNDRIKRELGIKLIYPTYREGLRALLKGESGA
ncbi:MAG: SDR family oxidoreductase [Alphaproteobacteria bacterium]|nr:SDR family oxidoreductase [Alphaproteobacteria bacterium]